jgi:hypothetical protein
LIKKLLFGLLSLSIDLPESLLELEDLTCLKPVESSLLSQLLVQGGYSLLELTSTGALSQLIFELSILVGDLSLLGVLLVNVLLEASDFFLLSHEKLLEGFDFGLEGWSIFLNLDISELVISFLLGNFGDYRFLRFGDWGNFRLLGLLLDVNFFGRFFFNFFGLFCLFLFLDWLLLFINWLLVFFDFLDLLDFLDWLFFFLLWLIFRCNCFLSKQ